MHPELLRIPGFILFGHAFGPTVIFTYGFTLACAFLLGIMWGMREAREAGLPPEIVPDMSVYIIIMSIIFARLIFVVDDMGWYLEKPIRILMIRQGGLSFHGGVIGGTLAIIYYSIRAKIPLGKLTDILTPSLALGLAIGRLGCFLNGCCYGTPSNVFWALPVTILHDNTPRHPAQLYDLSISLALFFALQPLKRLRRKDGDLVGMYLIIFSFERFFVEIFRQGASSKYYFGTHVTLAQWVSIPILIGGLMIYFWPSKNVVEPVEAAMTANQSGDNKTTDKPKTGNAPKKKKNRK